MDWFFLGMKGQSPISDQLLESLIRLLVVDRAFFIAKKEHVKVEKNQLECLHVF